MRMAIMLATGFCVDYWARSRSRNWPPASGLFISKNGSGRPVIIPSLCRGFDETEHQAGYDARRANLPLSETASRSWRAGWDDADVVLEQLDKPLQ